MLPTESVKALYRATTGFNTTLTFEGRSIVIMFKVVIKGELFIGPDVSRRNRLRQFKICRNICFPLVMCVGFARMIHEAPRDFERGRNTA